MVSVSTAPPKQGAELETDDRHDRQQRVAERVAQDDAPFAEPLGARRPHVVAAEDVEQAGAGDAGDDRQRDRAQRDRRQDQVAERVDRTRPTGR